MRSDLYKVRVYMNWSQIKRTDKNLDVMTDKGSLLLFFGVFFRKSSLTI